MLFLSSLSLVGSVGAEDLSGLDRGHRLTIEHGLQLAALVCRDITSPSLWTTSGYTTMIFSDHQTSTGGGAAGRIADLDQMPDAQWGRLTWSAETHPGVVTAPELPDLPRLTMLQYLDERSITDPTQIADDKATLASWRTLYPDAIGYTNQYGSQAGGGPTLQAYIAQTEPDMLYFDRYVFRGSSTVSGPSYERSRLYYYMQVYRTVGLAGHDGTGTTPIPYGMYTQNTVIPGYTYDASGSETNLQYFGALAFGFKSLAAFTYARPKAIDGLQHSMFEAANTIVDPTNGQAFDSDPKQMFWDVAEANRQSANLGPALVRLLSTDVAVDRGLQSDGVTLNQKASNVDDWTPATDTFITSITAINNGTLNGGHRGDVTIGYFEPLVSGFLGDTDDYFMVVNGATDANGTPAQTSQTLTLTFDFGVTGVTSLQRLSRDTGQVEVIDGPSEGWTHLGGSQYELVLTLEGGAGDLFKPNTGGYFVGFVPISSVRKPWYLFP